MRSMVRFTTDMNIGLIPKSKVFSQYRHILGKFVVCELRKVNHTKFVRTSVRQIE